MLVPPQIVSRPGEHGSPAGACRFTNASHPDDGPYALVAGEYFSKGPIKDLAKAVGLLVSDDAQSKYEKLLTELVSLRTANESMLEEHEGLRQALQVATSARQAAEARVAELEDVLGRTKPLGAYVEEYLFSNPSEKKRP